MRPKTHSRAPQRASKQRWMWWAVTAAAIAAIVIVASLAASAMIRRRQQSKDAEKALLERRIADQAIALRNQRSELDDMEARRTWSNGPASGNVRVVAAVIPRPPLHRPVIDETVPPQIGYLAPEGGWEDEGDGCPADMLLPLHGGPSPLRRERYHYFALWSGPVGASAPIRVPVYAPVADHGNRDDRATRRVSCLGDVGCGQLFDGDLVAVPDAAGKSCRWRVRLY